MSASLISQFGSLGLGGGGPRGQQQSSSAAAASAFPAQRGGQQQPQRGNFYGSGAGGGSVGVGVGGMGGAYQQQQQPYPGGPGAGYSIHASHSLTAMASGGGGGGLGARGGGVGAAALTAAGNQSLGFQRPAGGSGVPTTMFGPGPGEQHASLSDIVDTNLGVGERLSGGRSASASQLSASQLSGLNLGSIVDPTGGIQQLGGGNVGGLHGIQILGGGGVDSASSLLNLGGPVGGNVAAARGVSSSGSSCIVKMRGLPYHSSPSDILNFFNGYNAVSDTLQIGLDSLGRPSGEAWITFQDPGSALLAVRELNRHYLGNRYLELSVC